MTKQLKDNVNKWFGAELVREVFMQDMHYLPKEQFHNGAPKI